MAIQLERDQWITPSAKTMQQAVPTVPRLPSVLLPRTPRPKRRNWQARQPWRQSMLMVNLDTRCVKLQRHRQIRCAATPHRPIDRWICRRRSRLSVGATLTLQPAQFADAPVETTSRSGGGHGPRDSSLASGRADPDHHYPRADLPLIGQEHDHAKFFHGQHGRRLCRRPTPS